MPLLADASGCTLASVQALSERDGWNWAGTVAGDVAARLRAIAADLLTRMEALGRKALDEGAKIDRTEVDGIVAIIRGLDKIGEIMRPDEAAKENQIKQVEDLAAILDRIDRRILELARDLAAQMVAGECGLHGSGDGEIRVGA